MSKDRNTKGRLNRAAVGTFKLRQQCRGVPYRFDASVHRRCAGSIAFTPLLTQLLMANEDVPLASERPFWVLYEKQLNGRGIPKWEPPQL